MRISVIIFVGFAAILVMFALTTFVNYRQSQVVYEDAEWVATSQQIIRSASRLQRNMVEMQSNLRGFLLTGETLFLDSYRLAMQENAELIKELTSLIPNNSPQKRELTEILMLYGRWQNEFAGPLIEARQQVGISARADRQFDRLYSDELKKHLDQYLSEQIRNKFRELTNYVYDLRAQRRERLNDTVGNTRLLSITLTTASIVLGFAIALYITVVTSRRIRQMVKMAERLAEGNFKTPVEDRTRDELGHLARSLNSTARILGENISELERKNQELDRFAYVVSHDLKAPLRGIENLSSWMEEDFGPELPPKAREYIQLMKGRIRRMESLIDGILEISRIGKGKKTVERVDVYRLVREAVDMVSPDPLLKVHIQPNLPTIYTERIPLQQVFTNLISNAVKYHHRGVGNIFIKFQELDQYYEFLVKDDGPGIDPRYHQKIFIIFQTLQARDTLESTGVGLAIVKKILDDKKCTIRVVSEVDKGATFIFTWPKAVNASYLSTAEAAVLVSNA